MSNRSGHGRSRHRREGITPQAAAEKALKGIGVATHELPDRLGLSKASPGGSDGFAQLVDREASAEGGIGEYDAPRSSRPGSLEGVVLKEPSLADDFIVDS